MQPAVDVIIPTRDTRDTTLCCVEALVGDEGVDVSCVLVDNGSADGTAVAVAARWPDVDLLRSDSDTGYGRACNLGAARGSAEFVLFLNSDAIARPGALRHLVSFLAERPRHVVAGGRLVDVGTDRPQVGFAIRGFPSLANQVALMVGLERYWPRNPISRRHLMLDFDYERTQDIDAQPAGACLLCRRADFEAVGGFDESFHYWFEDVDLVRRLRERGSIGYVHDAAFEHIGGGTFRQWSRQEVVTTRYRSLIRYFSKHHPTREVLALRFVIGALALLRAVLLVGVDRQGARAYAEVVGLALRGA